MKLTVVIPTIGRRSLIKAVNSALNVEEIQKIFIVKDRDAKVQKFENNKVEIITIDNKDACSKRNAGLKLVKTEYVLFLDDDDELCFENFSEFYDLLCKPKCAGIFFDAKIMCEGRERVINKKSGMIKQSDLIFRNVVGTTSSVILKVIILQNNKVHFDSRNLCRQDYDLWIRLLNIDSLYLQSTSKLGLVYNNDLHIDRVSKQKFKIKLISLIYQYLRHLRMNGLLTLTIFNHMRYLLSSILNR
jgi:glycosyltransferase involved in cell wall biosynthesis